MFSQIAATLGGETNPLYRLRDHLVSRGKRVTDLVSGNVNEHGIQFPEQLLKEILCDSLPACRIYRPDSLGQRPAREAIASYYASQSVQIPESQILLTPGTSISYWYCFKLLANENEEILCPRPSYPLFDYIAALSGVRMIPYRMRESDAWNIDLDHLEASISTKTRALVLISPHNPTGHVSPAGEIAALARIAERHDLAIISDEVFNEFLLGDESFPRPAESGAPLVFTLNGFSKMLALPGIKLGWMGVTGARDKVAQAMRALELISDTFLPVNEIIQAAAPRLLERGSAFRADYAREIRRRWEIAESILHQNRFCDFIPPAGGFYITLRLKYREEEEAAESILRQQLLLAHPGHFYELDPSHLVLTFVQEPACIRDYMPRLLASLA